MAVEIVICMQGFANFRLILREIFERDETAHTLHVVHDQLRGFAAIKLGCAVFRDALESCGQLGLTEGIAGVKHFSVVQKNAPADGELLQLGAFVLQFAEPVFR